MDLFRIGVGIVGNGPSVQVQRDVVSVDHKASSRGRDVRGKGVVCVVHIQCLATVTFVS